MFIVEKECKWKLRNFLATNMSILKPLKIFVGLYVALDLKMLNFRRIKGVGILISTLIEIHSKILKNSEMRFSHTML